MGTTWMLIKTLNTLAQRDLKLEHDLGTSGALESNAIVFRLESNAIVFRRDARRTSNEINKALV